MHDELPDLSEPNMKKSKTDYEDELRPEYDLTKLENRVRAKYAAAFREGTNLILLEPDVFEAFPNADAVNRALRSLLDANKASKAIEAVR